MPKFETLESRTMLTGAATLTLSGGELTMTEPAGTSDSLTITESGDNYLFTNTAGFASASGTGVSQPSNDEVDVATSDSLSSMSIALGGVINNAINLNGSANFYVSGNVLLTGIETVTEAAAFDLTAYGLAIDTSAVFGSAGRPAIDMAGQFNIFTFAAKTDGGSINVYGSSLQIGNVDGYSGVDTTDGGVRPAGADAVFGTNYSIALNASINAGQAAAQLASTTGGITQSAGTITAASLGVYTEGGNAAGNIVLNQNNALVGASASAGVFAADAAGGGSVSFENGGAGVIGLQIGGANMTGAAATAIGSPYPVLSGINTVAAVDASFGPGNISVSTVGTLQVAQQINAGSGIVELAAASGISESGGGITAGQLAVIADGGDITLDQTNFLLGPSSAAGVFAADDLFAGGSVTLANSGSGVVGLQIGSVALTGAAASAATSLGLTSPVQGITTANSMSAPYTNQVNLVASGAIVLDDKINAGFAAVELSAGGSITETGTNGNTNGVWAASLVAVAGSPSVSGGTILLNQVNRLAQPDGAPGLLAAEDYSPGAPITIYSMAGTLQVDSLSATAVELGTITGITTTNNSSGSSFSNNIDLLGNTSIILNAGLNAGFAGVELRALGTSITETGTNGNTNGVWAASLVAVAGSPSVGGGTILLNQVNRLAQPDGAPGLLAAEDDSPGAPITIYSMAGTLQVDSLSAAAVALGTITGITTTNNSSGSSFGNNIDLLGNTSIILNARLNAGFAGVELRALGPSITETGTNGNTNGVWAASLVAVAGSSNVADSIILLNQVNIITGSGGGVGLLAAADSSPGGSITIYNMGSTTQVDSLSGAGLGLGTIAGISTTNSPAQNPQGVIHPIEGTPTTNTASGPFTNSINLWGIGGILLNNQVNAGFGQVTLHSPVSITEAAGAGKITASALAVLIDGSSTTGSNVQLNQPNQLIQSDGSAGLLAVSNLSPGGSVTVDDTGGATQIDSLDTGTVAGPTIAGVTTTNSASAPYTNQVNLLASSAIVLNDKINAGFAGAELRAGGSITETSTKGDTNGVWAGSLLAVAGSSNVSGSIILLNQVNRLAQPNGAQGLLAAEDDSPGAPITIYSMAGTLQVDSLSGAGVGLGTITGITTTNNASGSSFSNNIDLLGNTTIYLNADLNAGFAEVELRALAGSIIENANDTITAGALGVEVDATVPNGSVVLGQSNSLVGSGGTAGLIAIVVESQPGLIILFNANNKPLHETTLSMSAVALTTITGVSTAGGGGVSILPTPS
ncbi:MAG TPA: hypothetical protein VHV55_24460 [Pirellulales bacterium]|jgi:hypothetical protein|nr:hypothetical protein [Pirellulales bacterium]